MTTPTYEKTRPAARLVERIALDKTDEVCLKEVLGLVQPDGSLAPDDNNVYNFPPADRGPGAKDPDGRTTPATDRRDRSAVPPGLRDLPPETAEEEPKKRRGPKPQPKVIRPRKERKLAPCGTVSAYSRHKRRIKAGVPGEVMDDACLEAGRKYHREYNQNKAQRAEEKRLKEAGVKSKEAIKVLAERAR